jgi:hypothetical protein
VIVLYIFKYKISQLVSDAVYNAVNHKNYCHKKKNFRKARGCMGSCPNSPASPGNLDLGPQCEDVEWISRTGSDSWTISAYSSRAAHEFVAGVPHKADRLRCKLEDAQFPLDALFTKQTLYHTAYLATTLEIPVICMAEQTVTCAQFGHTLYFWEHTIH